MEIGPDNDSGRLLDEIAGLSARLTELYGEYRLGTIGIVVEVLADGDPFVIGCSDCRRWVQQAFLEEAAGQAARVNELERFPAGEDDE